MAAARPRARVVAVSAPGTPTLTVVRGPGTDIHRRIQLDRDAWRKTPEDIQSFRDYADGVQDPFLTDGQKTALKGLLGHKFCDNVSHQIIATDADRLVFEGWEVATDREQGYLDDLYVQNNLESESAEAHYAVCRDGDFAITVSWDNDYQRVILTREEWWDGQEGIFIGYDKRGFPLYAVREWEEVDGTRRRVIWYEDHLERWIADGRSTLADVWQPWNLPGEPASSYEDWLKPDGSPLHIPVVHFANGGRGPGNYGRSELDGGVMGFQDQINDSHYDSTAAGRFTGFQMYWMAGVPIQNDPKTGIPIKPQNAPGVWHHSDNPDAKYGHFPAGDIGALIDLYEMKLKAVCRMTRTPYHLITGGDWPSGEALWQAEKPLVMKLRKQVAKVKPAWVEVGHRAMEVANVFARLGLSESPDTSMIKALFEDVERRDPLTMAMADKTFWDAAVSANQAGIPTTIYLKKRGWTDQEIQELLAAQQEEHRRDLQRQQDVATMQAQVAAASEPPPAAPGVQGGS
jgi:hypothetical protein